MNGQAQRRQAPNTSNQMVTFDEKVDDCRRLLNKMKDQFAAALPAHIKPERLIRITLTTVRRTPRLLDCTPESFFGALMQCAALGLEPDGVLGQAHLIPFWNGRAQQLECQFIPGYRGLIKLAMQTAYFQRIFARPVREADEFRYEFGLNESLVHKPHRGEDAGPLVAVYSIAHYRDGQPPQFDVMERWQIDAIRDRSSGYKDAVQKKRTDSPWITDYEPMAVKTGLRKLCKMLPASVEKAELALAVALDEAAEAEVPQQFQHHIDLPALRGEQPRSRLAEVTAESRQRREGVVAAEPPRGNEDPMPGWAGGEPREPGEDG